MHFNPRHYQYQKKRYRGATFFPNTLVNRFLNRFVTITVNDSKPSTDPAIRFRGRFVPGSEDHEFAPGRWEVLIP